MPYKFFEDIAIADVAFEAKGKSLNELFESAAMATTNVMVKDLKSLGKEVKKTIELKSSDIESLLYDFLQEIVYYKDAESLLFGKYEVEVNKEDEDYSLKATIYGDKINMKKQELTADVKAVTLHKFEVKKTRDGWSAFVILDI